MAGQRTVHPGLQRRGLVAAQHLGQGAAHDLLAPRSQPAFEAAVDEAVAPIDADHRDHRGDGLRHRAQRGALALQLLLRLGLGRDQLAHDTFGIAALGDVKAGREDTAHRAVVGQIGHKTQIAPPDLAAHGLFDLKALRLAGQRRQQVRLDLGSERVFTQDLAARAAQDLLARQAKALAMRLVDKAVAAFAVDVGNAQRQAVGDLAHELLMAGQALLQVLAFGDVLEGAQQTHRRAFFKLHLAHRTHPDRTTACGDEWQFQVPGLAGRHGGLNRSFDDRPGLGRVEGDGRFQRRHEVVRHLVDVARALGPVQGPAGQIQLPAADTGHAAGAAQEVFAGGQRHLGAPVRGDVTAHRMQQRRLPVAPLQRVGPGHPMFHTVGIEHAVFRRAADAALPHAEQLTPHRVAVHRFDVVKQVGAQHAGGAQPEVPRVGRVDVHQRAVGIGQRDHFRLRFDDGPVARITVGQRLLLGLRGRQRAVDEIAPHHQRLAGHLRQLHQHRRLLGAQLAALAVNDTQRAHPCPARQHQRRAGVEADARRPGHQRVVGKARVLGGIADLHQVVRRDGVRAEGLVARCLVDAGQAHVGLEPLPFGVDQADQRDGHAADLGSQARQAVKDRLGRAVQHHQCTQGRDAVAFVAQRGLPGRGGFKHRGWAVMRR